MDSQERHRGAGAPALEPLLVATGLMLAVSYRFFEPIWQVGPGLLALGLLTGAAYLAGYVATRRSGRGGWGMALLVTIIASQPVLLALKLMGLPFSRAVLAYELILLYVGLAAAGARVPARLRVPAAFAFATLAVLPTVAGLRAEAAADGSPGASDHRYVFSSYYDLSLTTYDVLEHELQDGGGLTLMPEGRVLLVAGSGTARMLDLRDGLRSWPVDLGLPLDVEAFRALGLYQPEFYRVFDVLYDEGRLFVTYIHWDRAQGCYALRLAESDLDGTVAGPWTTRFESRPCVPLPHPFNTSGGRLAVLDASRLLLSVGSFGMEEYGDTGWREGSDYGKVLVLDRTSWRTEVFSVGHRNPEGLLVAGDRIWSTEHGPHGGDELNLVEAGSDYGWPVVSYGTDYGRKTLASGRTPGDHSGFVEPVYSWTPSVGISSLIDVSDGLFPRWQDDLLVGSLSGLGNGRSLMRVRLVSDAVVNVEKIPMDSRVRDLLQLPGGGPIVLWDGAGSIRVLRPADHVFSQCAGCHGVRNAQHGIGPDLYGVVGNPVAHHENYEYSAALRRYGGTWTPARLDRFLAGPQAEVPGTAMEHEGVPDPQDRVALVQFLEEIGAGRPAS